MLGNDVDDTVIVVVYVVIDNDDNDDDDIVVILAVAGFLIGHFCAALQSLFCQSPWPLTHIYCKPVILKVMM